MATPTRERIVQLVRSVPGASTSRLAQEASLDDTTVGYHLRRLARDGLVASETAGREIVWYDRTPGCAFCPVLRRAIPLLQREGVRAITMVMGPDPRSVRGIARDAQVHPASARRALETMREIGLAARTQHGRVILREGAETCLAKATAKEPCAEWGRCPVSKAWAARLQGET